MRKILNLLRGRRTRLERDLDRELRYHFDRRVEDMRAEGLGEDEARRRAAIEMGGIVQVQEDVRETWARPWGDSYRKTTTRGRERTRWSCSRTRTGSRRSAVRRTSSAARCSSTTFR